LTTTPESSREVGPGNSFRDQFFENNPAAKSVIDLFDFLPSVYFYAKDCEHRYIGINKATLTNVFGLEDAAELFGRTDADFQPAALAEAYHAEDVGVMYPIKTPKEQANYFQELTPVVKFIDANYTDQISMSEMADIAGLSATHFNQRFKAIFQMSPTAYVLSRRIQLAQKLLVETNKTISQVSAAVGFYDQSHFTKRFGRVTGLTPKAYRSQYR